jgi:hypothetical protein
MGIKGIGKTKDKPTISLLIPKEIQKINIEVKDLLYFYSCKDNTEPKTFNYIKQFNRGGFS